jgi:hypothetical protein
MPKGLAIPRSQVALPEMCSGIGLRVPTYSVRRPAKGTMIAFCSLRDSYPVSRFTHKQDFGACRPLAQTNGKRLSDALPKFTPRTNAIDRVGEFDAKETGYEWKLG